MAPPDPGRIGGVGWLERTGGRLTPGDKLRLVPGLAVGFGPFVVSQILVRLGRVTSTSMAMPTVPKGALAEEAASAAATQSGPVEMHSYRTWAFGRTLAMIDGRRLDEEIFYVAALLHDQGLDEPVRDEDFTLRSGHEAARVLRLHRPDAEETVRNAIAAHATPGASVEVDGPEAFYVQAGAMCDLAGLRLQKIHPDLVDRINDTYSRDSVFTAFMGHVAAEADAVPDGRFAFLKPSLQLGMRLGLQPKG